MRKLSSTKNGIEAPSAIQIVSDTINKRGDSVEDKIKRLEALLIRCREQIRKTRPGPAQDAAKARALRVLKQKRKYEVQRDMLYSQTASLDQVSVAREEIKDRSKRNGSRTLRPSLFCALFSTCCINS